jgi:DNA-binding CsgD family transcriptional regulator/tetratricopeptide (TPR) repeat protein
MGKPAQGPFIGRAEPLRELTRLAEEAQHQHPRIALIAGESGIGKSRLVAHFTDSQAQGGALILLGVCPPIIGSALPLAPIVQMLRSLEAQITGGPDELSVNPTELQRLVFGTAAPSGSRPQPTLIALCEEFLRLLDRLAKRQSLLVLVLEDLHWADVSTLDVLAFLARNLRDTKVLIIGTYRVEMNEAAEQFGRLLIELARAEPVETIEVGPLPSDDIAELIRQAGPARASSSTVERIVALADGNPFFAEELLASSDRDAATLPRTLRDAVLARTSMLGPEAKDVLRLATAAGRRVRAQLLVAAMPQAEPLISQAIRALVAERFLVPDVDRDGVLAVRHAIVREVIYDDLLAPERSRLHGNLARALVADPELAVGTELERLIEVAVHWDRAGDAIRAFPALVRAADGAASAYAFREAYALYWRAIARAERLSGPAQELKRPIGFHLEPQRVDELGDIYRRAAEAASLAGYPDQAARWVDAAMGRPGSGAADLGLLAAAARYAFEAGETERALSLYERASSIDPDDPSSRARVQVGYARVLLAAGRTTEAAALGARAVAAADESGHLSDQYMARSILGTAQAAEGRMMEALATLDQARQMFSGERSSSTIRPRPSRVMDLMATYAEVSTVLKEAGQGGEAKAVAREGADAAQRFGAVAAQAHMDTGIAEALYESGSWNEAAAACDRILEALPTVVIPRLLRARIASNRGDWESAVADLTLVEQSGDAPPNERMLFHLALAELRYWRRQLTEAASAVVDGLSLSRPGQSVSAIELRQFGVRIAADQHAEAKAMHAPAIMSSTMGTAQQLAAELEALVASSGDSVTITRSRALLALAHAELSRIGGPDPSVWEVAADAWSAIGDRCLEAYARYRHAEATLAVGGPRAGPSHSLREANRVATGLDASPLLAEIGGLARRARIDLLESSGVASDVAEDRGGLTLGLSSRELEVLRLIALGRTNRQIGDELFITEKTAGHHVSNILGKLGVTNRLEAASLAHRMGLDDPESRTT